MGRRYTLKEALGRIYLVKPIGKTGGAIYLPDCMVGKRVKLVLVDDEED